MESTRHRVPPELAADLRRWRVERGWSQEALGRRVRVSRAFVSNLECGIRAPSVAVAVALASVLGLPDRDRGRLMEHARLAGRSSPWRTGDWL
jgi:transcriptional regulator with XRE-family HTH domain